MPTKISASIDIGTRNFAFCVEEYDSDLLNEIPHIQELHRYNPDGTPTPAFAHTLKTVYNAGNIIEFKNVDLAKGVKGKGLDQDILHNMIDLLDEYQHLWQLCDVILIEEQMHFRGIHNVKALKVAQHCATYFLIRYGRNVNVLEYDANLKYKVIGAPKIQNVTKTGKITYKSMPKPERKKWSPSVAKQILTQRGDSLHLNILNTAKADDLADCLLQALSYWILYSYNEIQ